MSHKQAKKPYAVNNKGLPQASAETDVDVVVRYEQIGHATSIYKINF